MPPDPNALLLGQSDSGPKASERTYRDWREIVSAAAQHVYDQLAPVNEGYASLPADARGCLASALADLERFDKVLAKIDGDTSASGGVYELIRMRIEARHA